jgi:hypothetical protein
MLCQTFIYHGNKTFSLAKTTRTAFEKEYNKLLKILKYINDYNHRAKTVNQKDQLKCYKPGLRLIRQER